MQFACIGGRLINHSDSLESLDITDYGSGCVHASLKSRQTECSSLELVKLAVSAVVDIYRHPSDSVLYSASVQPCSGAMSQLGGYSAGRHPASDDLLQRVYCTGRRRISMYRR